MLRLWTLLTIVGLSLAQASKKANTSSTPSTSGTSGKSPVVAIDNSTSFCLFLPPQEGLVVATHETNGIPFCTSAVKGSHVLPEGFITTAHYARTSGYVQITGFFDRTKYNLQATDGGGQYDSHDKGKPIGASCHGYPYFVSLIEPENDRFCIRCCQSVADCPPGRSQYGCARVVPGDYSMLGNASSIVASQAPTQTATQSGSQSSATTTSQTSISA